MRKKWIIIAGIASLSVMAILCVMHLHNQNGYSSDAVVAEISKHNVFAGTHAVAESRIEMPVFKSRPDPLGIRRLISWFEFEFRYRNHTIPILGPPSIFFSANGSDYMKIILHTEDDQIIEVEIIPHSGMVQDGKDIQSKLSKAFPDLPCKITGDKKLKFVRP
jgi:hypothetical protein